MVFRETEVVHDLQIETPDLVMRIFSILVIGLCFISVSAQSQQQDETLDTEVASARFAKQLSNSDPVTRQSAAEALAKLVAIDQKKLVEGYILQEKDKRVRLALNWALYRLGKSQTLYEIVRDLDSSRHDQAAGYLALLEGPEPLYIFLKQDNTPFKVKIRIIEVLGQIGDSETLKQIKPFNDAFELQLAEAAQASTKQIQERLAQPQPTDKTRPRVVTKREQP